MGLRKFVTAGLLRLRDSELIPLCEQNYNLVELGPRGTGKSYVFQELSPYTILLTGPTTVANLFFNMATGKMGLVGLWDCVAFDEVADLQTMPKEVVTTLKGSTRPESFRLFRAATSSDDHACFRILTPSPSARQHPSRGATIRCVEWSCYWQPLRLDYMQLKKCLGGVPSRRRKPTKSSFVLLITPSGYKTTGSKRTCAIMIACAQKLPDGRDRRSRGARDSNHRVPAAHLALGKAALSDFGFAMAVTSYVLIMAQQGFDTVAIREIARKAAL